MKILVIDDEAPTAAFLRRGLSEEGFAVDVARDAASADQAVQVNDYDAIVLDVMLPTTNGFALCKEWRARGVRTPILFLTARDDVADRVRGLNMGGDDYLVKPFAFAELLARVRALVRRGAGPVAAPELRVGDLCIDTNRRSVTRDGNEVPLSLREYQLLEYLMQHANRIISRTELWEHVWASDSVPDSNVVDVYVRYLRNKLGREPEVIETVRGVGYIIRSTPLKAKE